jgi:hypothetical protein
MRNRLRATENEVRREEECLEIGRRIEAGEPLTGDELYKYYEKDIFKNVHAYHPPSRLEGRIHLVLGNKWAEDRKCLVREYLESEPVELNLGEVDHLGLVTNESTAMRWIELVCVLANPSFGSERQGSTEA